MYRQIESDLVVDTKDDEDDKRKVGIENETKTETKGIERDGVYGGICGFPDGREVVPSHAKKEGCCSLFWYKMATPAPAGNLMQFNAPRYLFFFRLVLHR